MNSPVMFALIALASFLTIGMTQGIAKDDIISKVLADDGMELIGQVGNKVFFKTVDPYPETNWYGAQSICNQTGLTVAKIANWTEFRFVFEHLPMTTPLLWIGGTLKGFKTQQTKPAFEWEDNSEIASELFVHHFPIHWICYAFARGNDAIYTDFCIDGRHRAICQAIVD